MNVEFGFKLPNCGGVLCPPDWAKVHTIERLAREADQSGFSSLWLHDHLLIPSELSHLHEPNFFEPLILAARLASIVEDVRIGVATLILPFREPVLLGRQLSAMEAIFPGRLVLGVGSGRYESEFESFGVDFAQRGRITDDYLRVLRGSSSDSPLVHQSAYRTINGAVSYPHISAGSPPIWIGGNSNLALRRAAKYGDGWVPAAITAEALSVQAARLEQYLGEASKLTEDFTTALSVTINHSAAGDEDHLHRHVMEIVGDADEVAERLVEYTRAGVSHFLVSLIATSIECAIAEMEWFCTQVVPLVRNGS